MTRLLKDWLPAYLDYTSGTEAPRLMHFWSGVSAIAGALRRRVWIDMKRFQWTPNFYIIFVAKPGVVSKTTTMDLAMDLLKRVPGIHFGPDAITWQTLPGELSNVNESFLYGEDWLPMSPLTLASGELGSLIDPYNKEMMNFYIQIWEGRKSYDKKTKTSGSDAVEAPWVNMIGCTTPHWIADNMPTAAIGGGFTSRCIFVYGEKKERFIALPDEFIIPNHEAVTSALVADLEHIATALVGPFTINEEARAWMRKWYENLWTVTAAESDEAFLEGYIARKQTHLMKLSMILSVSRSDALVVEKGDFELAEIMLKQTEVDFAKVFSRIGKSEESLQADRFIQYVKRQGAVPYATAYRYVHSAFPDFKDFEGIVAGAVRSGIIATKVCGPNVEYDLTLVYTGPL